MFFNILLVIKFGSFVGIWGWFGIKFCFLFLFWVIFFILEIKLFLLLLGVKTFLVLRLSVEKFLILLLVVENGLLNELVCFFGIDFLGNLRFGRGRFKLVGSDGLIGFFWKWFWIKFGRLVVKFGVFCELRWEWWILLFLFLELELDFDDFKNFLNEKGFLSGFFFFFVLFEVFMNKWEM